MFTWLERWTALVLLVTVFGAQAQERFPGIGRVATPQEVAAWDIDVRPDLKGLPAGAGSVAKGQDVWEAKCASCHGVFGEATEVFNPLVGGTTADDIKTGNVAALRRLDYPSRTTLMKVSQVSTLWDYINRAMPWSQPKSLSVEEVYAVTAYLLNLGGVVPNDFVLSDKTMAEAQKRLPNRNGKTTAHALWPGRELGGAAKPDVNATACMSNCKAGTTIASSLPAHARNAHGDLSEQNRTVGPQRGAQTLLPELPQGTALAPLPPVAPTAATKPAAATAPASTAPASDAKAVQALLQKNTCTACHAASSKLVGPSWAEVAKKHAGKAEHLAAKIRSGGSGVWGPIPMPPQALAEPDARRIAAWLAAGATP
ncbi:c-type cytochrome [uncultured Ramlibacter sp.]|uniref:c-type cytochrome n=1 Tax=uncultured Ramlibacter sp. TaxID=260755 RepID=UPI00262BAB8F|nr:c-type cytochrome [uncultured Ramlibacter sp.]